MAKMAEMRQMEDDRKVRGKRIISFMACLFLSNMLIRSDAIKMLDHAKEKSQQV